MTDKKPLIEIKPHELSLLSEARNLLRELEARVTETLGDRAMRPALERSQYKILHMGRAMESAYAAADAISDYLITLDSFMDMDIPKDILHGSPSWAKRPNE